MDKKYFEEIVNFMSKTIAEYDFKAIDGEEFSYKNEKIAFKIVYDDKNQFCLMGANVNDGAVTEYKTRAAWLFTDDHSAKDTLIIAEDFEEAVLKALGVKKSVVSAGGEVALPEKTEAGQAPNIEGLTQKLLAIYPEFKDTYKTEVARTGEFLYIDFMKKTFIPKMRDTVRGGNNKQITKLMDMLGKMYYEGDTTVSNTVIGVLVAGTFKNDVELFEKCAALAEGYPYLKSAGTEILKCIAKNKKYAEIFD